jgi:CxxC motif-containing protein (DUF1111 family)
MNQAKWRVVLVVLVVMFFGVAESIQAQFRAKDPGVRGGAAGAGGPLQGLTTAEGEMFTTGLADFSEAEEVDEGLGPRFNFTGCAGCHMQPAVGGTSPAANPLVQIPGVLGFRNNVVPSFITANGPIREVRFQFNRDGSRDGGVHALFVISGHPDAPGCFIRQEDFETQVRNNNVAFRIPTPTFGTGLIEQISDSTILANLSSNATTKSSLGISGRVNRSGNDGTITRFGWKAQNKSLIIFSGEAYNVEMGITNEAFQQERDETPSCQFATVPNDVNVSVRQVSAISNFANFQRFLAAPIPSPDTPGGSFSINKGRDLFSSVGCVHCHTPSLKTSVNSTVGALANKTANLYSDLALHQMGPNLADEILQGAAKGDEFRTAPLWGLGKRIFFLHDGRTKDLDEAIQAHRSSASSKFGASEANAVIDRYNRLSEGDQQHVLNFLRSL